jgi:Transglutaminase-like superfamily
MTPGSLDDAVAARGGLSLDYVWEKLLSLVQAFRPPDGWLSVVLLAFNLMVVVWSVERADWVPTPSLVYLILLAMLTGLVLSRIPLWTALVLPVGLALGLLVIVWQLTSFRAEGMELANAAQLWQRLNLWFDAAQAGAISIDPIPFAFGLMVATWLSGYLAGWVFFRYRNFWGVFILGGAGLLSNLTYLPATASIYLAIYLLTALLLVGRVQAVRRRQEWKRRNFQYDDHLGLLAISDSFFIGLAALLVAFLLPVGHYWEPTHSVYEFIRSPMIRWEDDFNRLFAGLPARRPLPYRIWGDVIPFQGTINPTTTPVLQVNSPVPMYWKARTYGTYTPKGWVSSDTILETTDWTPTYSVPRPYLRRFEVTYEVTPNYPSKSLFAGGQIISVDQDARIETYDSPTYTVDLLNPAAQQNLHPDLARATANLEQTINTRGGTVNDSALAQSLPPGLELAEVIRGGQGAVEQVVLAEVIPEQPDTLSLRSAGGEIKRGQTYEITSSVSLAQPQELRLAGEDYPLWAVTQYTQLPPTLPQRVRDLADQITANANTPYDKAKAIENYLKTFEYTLRVEPPPYNADGVDHFLFNLKRGYSEYFGSAMTVLLRTQGIPARLATGYTVGDELPDQEDVFIVNDSHSHAWVEVFFPRYGWITFEPTPGNSLPLATIPVQDPAASPFGMTDEDIFFGMDCIDDDDIGCEDDTPFLGGQTPGVDTVTLGQRLLQLLPWILGLGTLAALAGGFSWWFWRRYMVPSTDPELTFRHLAFLGNLNSVGPADYHTPFQYRQRLEEAFPSHREELSFIVNSYVRSMYGKKELNDQERQNLVRAWLGVRLPLLFHILRRRNQ